MSIAEPLERLKALSTSEGLQRLYAALGADAQLYLVGGTVRDAFLGRPLEDIDLASALLPQEIISRLERAHIRVIPTGLQHQTVAAVPITNERAVEITTFRGVGISPAKKVVASSAIEEDLVLRDFTVNALAFSFDQQLLVDPLHGVEDLKSQTLRACGTPQERFAEDPLRTLRMVRLACTLAFSIEPTTRQAASSFTSELSLVSAERIREEFTKILLSDRAPQGFSTLAELGLLETFLPELQRCVGFAQNRFHKSDVFHHTLDVVANTEPELVLRLAALFHDIAKPLTAGVNPKTGDRTFYSHEVVGATLTDEILTRLRFSNTVREQVVALVRTHMRPIECGPAGLRRLMRDTGELFDTWRKLKEADSLSTKVNADEAHEKLRRFDEEIATIRSQGDVSPLKNLALQGRDLLAAGIAAGPHVGEILRALHERVLDNPTLNNREALLSLLPEIQREVERGSATSEAPDTRRRTSGR